MTTLRSQRRGDPFDRGFTLGNEWTGTDFEEMWFTLRATMPTSDSAANDDDAVAQATLGGGSITVTGAAGRVLLPSSSTRTWPGAKRLYWDLQGRPTGDTNVYTIDSGDVLVAADVTRSQ